MSSAPWLCAMARVFDRAGAPLYAVGGWVRNSLMNLPVSDADVCGPTLPEDVCRLCEGTEVRAKIRTAAMGTVELYAKDENGVEQMAEYTAWRQDVYSGGHTPSEVRFTRDIEIDARRRDFSVNALYQRLHDGWAEDVLDPTGGWQHLKEGILHTTTENPDLILGNDGQRILRAARFQAELGLTPSDAMMDSLRRNARLVEELSLERMRDELRRLMVADVRYPGLGSSAAGLRTLYEIGVWDRLFPGIVFDQAAADALTRFPETIEKRLALMLRRASPEEALLRLRFTNKEAEAAARYASAYQNPDADLRALATLGLDALETAERMRVALGEDPRMDIRQQLGGKPLSLRDLAISGSDLKPLFEQHGIPLRQMGQMLDTLWQMTLSGEIANDKKTLLAQTLKSF